MIKKSFIIVFIFILIIPFGLSAKEKRGAQLMVLKKDGVSVQGELITVKTNSLLLLSSEGADVTITLENVEEIRVLKKSKLLLGGLTGTYAGQDKAYRVAEYQQTEMLVLISKLNKQARVPDFQ